MDTVPLRGTHLEECAILVANRYKSLRGRVSSLPSAHEDVGVILSMLRNGIERAPGVAAVRETKVVGFLLGLVIPTFRDRRAFTVQNGPMRQCETSHGGPTKRCTLIYPLGGLRMVALTTSSPRFPAILKQSIACSGTDLDLRRWMQSGT